MKRQIKFVLLVSLVISALLSFTPVDFCAAESGDTIKVGFLSSFSGPLAQVEAFYGPAVELAVEQANKQGGVLGRKIEIVRRDDQADPSQVPTKANELLGMGCVAIIGGILEPIGNALHVWSKDTKTIVLPNNLTLDSKIGGFHRYAFYAGIPNSYAMGTVIATQAASQPIKSVYTIAPDWVSTKEITSVFWKFLNSKKPGIRNLGEALMSGVESEFSSQISAALNTNPDMILFLLAGPSYVSFLQQAGLFGLFKKTKVFTNWGLGAEVTTPMGKNFPEGIQTTTWGPFYLDYQPMKTFSNEFRKKTNLYPADITLQFYNATLFLINAMKKAKSTDTEKIVEALENLSIESPLGNIKMHDYDHQANIPIWWATSGFSKNYPIAIGKNLTKYQDDVYLTKKEVDELRKGKK